MLHHNTHLSQVNLNPDHFQPYSSCLSSVLSTSLAEQTFSQIIDRLPITSVFYQYGYGYRLDIEAHEALCSKSVEAWRVFLSQFNPESLEVDAKLLQRYQNSERGSKQFKLVLLEIVAVAIHRIAVFLFQTPNPISHTPQEREAALNGPIPENEQRHAKITGLKPQIVDLYHPNYTDHQQYPNGVSDMVGYWAEYQLFGGVILFDRGSSGDENIEAFVDPPRSRWIFQLLPSQIQQLLDFSDNSTGSVSPPFPFQPERKARRVEHIDSEDLHIYRNPYDRMLNPPPRKWNTSYEEEIALQEQYDKMREEGLIR